MKNIGHDVLEIYLQPGDFYFGTEKTRIRTLLGSCVAITMWHPQKLIGGMCHYMLPHRPRNRVHSHLDGKYGEDAMKLFMKELKLSRTHPDEYQVKLFGGGRMFELQEKHRKVVPVADTNVQFGRKIIPHYGFSIAREDLGGEGHRTIILDLWSGNVWVKRAG